MTPERLELLLQGAQETDAVEFKAPVAWHALTFVKDILALANAIDGGVIIIGVENETFERIGVTVEQAATYQIDVMRDQIDPFADPRAIFTCQLLSDNAGLDYVVIEVQPFEDTPVICARDGADVYAGVIYYRSRSRRPESARISSSADMRDVIEAAIARRSRQLRRLGFVPAPGIEPALDEELGGL